MFRRVDDFVQAWDHEAESTIKVLAALSDSSIEQQVSPGHRTLGAIAWHIVKTPKEMLARTGLAIEGPGEDESAPTSGSTMLREYERTARSVSEHVKSDWTDASLDEVDEMYGEQWPRALTLSALIGHQIHHRGQMTILMRQAGLMVPGVIGPSKEEWAAFGMPAMP